MHGRLFELVGVKGEKRLEIQPGWLSGPQQVLYSRCVEVRMVGGGATIVLYVIDFYSLAS